MSWAFCETRHIKKTRKPHSCAFCNRIIPERSKNILYWAGLFDGEFYSSYACHWCESNQSRLVDDDNEIMDFWDCLREDIFEEEFREHKHCNCIDEKGFSGDIRARFDGDYLIFECEYCKKEWHREHMPIIRQQ